MQSMESALAAKRLVLVGPSRGSRGRDSGTVRRYKLARLKLENHPTHPRRPGAERFDHLKRSYD